MRELLLLGFDFRIPKDEVLLIASNKSKTGTLIRIIDDARASNRLIDCTRGRERRSIVISKSGYVFFSSITPQALHRRYERTIGEDGEGDDESITAN